MMGKFIEVHDSNGSLLLNTGSVVAFVPESDHTVVCLPGNVSTIRIIESYEEVRHMIAVAQGGIPMKKDRTVEGAPG